MSTTIPDEVPLDLPRLAELVLDQGQAIAALTAEVAAIRGGLAATYRAVGVTAPDALGARVQACARTIRVAYQGERIPVPEELAEAATDRPALTVVRGGAR